MKNISELQFLENLSDFGIKLGLDKIKFILEKLGSPHLKYPSILVGGTNGKGSVCKCLSEITRESGYKTGLYTSPHLVDVKERIVVNGEKITDEEFIEKIKQVRRIIEKLPYHMYPTYFETLTAIAFLYFYEKGIDIAVCEVGLGGRFDATNVLPSEINVITEIGLEHTKLLGKTYESIAGEKAGIIKEGSLVVVSKQRKEVEKVIKEKCKQRKAKIYFYGKDFKSIKREESIDGIVFDFYGKENFKNVKTKIIGSHQIENLSLAIQSSLLLRKKGFKVKKENIYSALENLHWEGRFEILKKDPFIIFDGAHNPDGVKVLIKNLKKYFPFKLKLLIGILKDKDYTKMLSYVSKYNPEEIVFTTPETERALDPEILSNYMKKSNTKIKVIKDVNNAMEYIKKTGDSWCIFGSLYLYSSVNVNLRS
ncbi:MAG TPA: folylpolyglutamate synthase/dihydrofolate synthase family protein [bacterium]|nr:folylpolyglutamate synthase/dihydrofolate synthase family protein [bacterium]